MNELVPLNGSNMTENNYVFEDLYNMCRLCLSRTALVSVFDPRLNTNENMREIVEVTTGVTISLDDDVSHMLCSKCSHLTIRMYKFRNTSMINDIELKEKASQRKKMHKSVQDLLKQEKLCIPQSIYRCNISPVVMIDKNVADNFKTRMSLKRKKSREQKQKVFRSNDDKIVENTPKMLKSAEEPGTSSMDAFIQSPTQNDVNGKNLQSELDQKEGDKEQPLFTIKTISKTLFICHVCNKVNYSAKELKKHKITHMRCTLCKTSFGSMEATKEHETYCSIKNIMSNQPKLNITRCDEDKELREKYRNAFRNFLIIEISDDEHESTNDAFPEKNINKKIKQQNIKIKLKHSNIVENETFGSQTRELPHLVSEQTCKVMGTSIGNKDTEKSDKLPDLKGLNTSCNIPEEILGAGKSKLNNSENCTVISHLDEQHVLEKSIIEKKTTDASAENSYLEKSNTEKSEVKGHNTSIRKSTHESSPMIPHFEKLCTPEDNVKKSDGTVQDKFEETVPDKPEEKSKEIEKSKESETSNKKSNPESSRKIVINDQCKKPNNTKLIKIYNSEAKQKSQTAVRILNPEKSNDLNSVEIEGFQLSSEMCQVKINQETNKIKKLEPKSKKKGSKEIPPLQESDKVLELENHVNKSVGINNKCKDLNNPEMEESPVNSEGISNSPQVTKISHAEISDELLNEPNESPSEKVSYENLKEIPSVDSKEVNKSGNKKLKRRKTKMENNSKNAKKLKIDKVADEELTTELPPNKNKNNEVIKENNNKNSSADNIFKPNIKFGDEDILEMDDVNDDAGYLTNLLKRIKKNKGKAKQAVQTSLPSNSDICSVKEDAFLYELKNLRGYLAFSQIPVSISYAKTPSIKFTYGDSSLKKSQEKLKKLSSKKSIASGGNGSNILLYIKPKKQATKISEPEQTINKAGNYSSIVSAPSSLPNSTIRIENVMTATDEPIVISTDNNREKSGQPIDETIGVSNTNPNQTTKQSEKFQKSKDILNPGMTHKNNTTQPNTIARNEQTSNEAAKKLNANTTLPTTSSNCLAEINISHNNIIAPHILNMSNPILSNNSAIPFVSYSINNIEPQKTMTAPQQFYLVRNSNPNGILPTPMTMITPSSLLAGNPQAFGTNNVLYGNGNPLNVSLRNLSFTPEVSSVPVFSSNSQAFGSNNVLTYGNCNSSVNVPSHNISFTPQVSSAPKLPPPMRQIRFKLPKLSSMRVPPASTPLLQTIVTSETSLPNAPTISQSMMTHVTSNSTSTVTQKDPPNPVFLAPQPPPLNRIYTALPNLHIVQKNVDGQNSAKIIHSSTTKDPRICDKLEQSKEKDESTTQNEYNKCPVSATSTTKYIRVKNLADLR